MIECQLTWKAAKCHSWLSTLLEKSNTSSARFTKRKLTFFHTLCNSLNELNFHWKCHTISFLAVITTIKPLIFFRSILKESSIVLKSAVCHQSYIRHSPFRCQSRFLAIDHQIVPEGAATLLPLLIVLHALR